VKFEKRLEEENIILNDFNKCFLIADVREIPFDNGFFNVVIDVATAWYVTYAEHNQVYQEINRVLKKDGLFYSWNILKGSWGDDEKNYIDKDTVSKVVEGPLEYNGVLYFGQFNDMIELQEKNGFKVIEKIYLKRTYENLQKALKYGIIIAKKI